MDCFCDHCRSWTTARKVDNGIGAYEYWGAPGRDVKLAVETFCCGTPAYVDENCEETISVRDFEEWVAGEREYYED